MTEPYRLPSGLQVHSAIVEHSRDFIGVATRDGNMMFLNGGGRRLIGIAADDDISKFHFLDFHPEEFASVAGNVIMPAIESTGSWTGRIQLRHTQTGATIDVIANCFEIKNENGEERYIGTIQQPWGEQQRVQEELKISEERLSMAVQATNEGVWDCDLVENTVWWNDAYNALYGKRPDETADSWEWWVSRIHPEDRKRVSDSLAAAAASATEFGNRWESEYRFERNDGSYAYVKDRAIIARDATGAATRILGTMRDDTELREAQAILQKTNLELAATIEELRQSEKKVIQQERLRAMGELAAGVSHNLNNLLSPAALLVDVLLQDPSLDENSRDAIDLIRSSAADAAALVKRLGGLYGKTNETTEPLNVSDILQEAIELTRVKWQDDARKSGKEIALKTQYDVVPTIEGNASELRQVFTNLIFNAVDAFQADGQIQIRLTYENGGALLEFADNGKGMSADEQKKCFDPFFTTKANGCGLGLATCVSIIDRHDGKLSVASKLGSGTTFRIALPIAVGKIAAPAKAATVDHNTPSRRILYIEDDPNVRRATALMLGHYGHEVDVAEHGPAGMALFQANHYDAVISDFTMAEMNGREVAAAVKSMRPETLVILVTGWPLSQLPVGMEHKEDHLLSKPVQFAELAQILGAGNRE